MVIDRTSECQPFNFFHAYFSRHVHTPHKNLTIGPLWFGQYTKPFIRTKIEEEEAIKWQYQFLWLCEETPAKSIIDWIFVLLPSYMSP